MKQVTVDWKEAVKPLLKKYEKEKHPLEAKSLYQMLVMVVLSAQTTDNLINQISQTLFEKFPNMHSLSETNAESLYPFISKVRGFRKKAEWLVNIAKEIKTDSNIPVTMGGLVDLPGIGRKSANVIKRYAGAEMEGIVVDLHTIRVANRLGIVDTEDPKKLEEQLMQVLPKKEWDAGMVMSFLGRDICRPDPKCEICLMRPVCAYYNNVVKKTLGEFVAKGEKDAKVKKSRSRK
jgi:endonuclease-3